MRYMEKKGKNYHLRWNILVNFQWVCFLKVTKHDLKPEWVTHLSSTSYHREFFFCSQCKWSLVHFLSHWRVVSHLLTNMHAFASKRHFNWELSYPSSPLGLVKNVICLLELISACLSPAGEFRVVLLNSSFKKTIWSSI